MVHVSIVAKYRGIYIFLLQQKMRAMLASARLLTEQTVKRAVIGIVEVDLPAA